MNEGPQTSAMATPTTNAEQASEESRNLNKVPEEQPSGAKAPAHFAAYRVGVETPIYQTCPFTKPITDSAPVKSCPDTRQLAETIPATMRAVVYHGVNDLRLETVPVPQIGPGELLVKIATCGICGTDLKKIHAGSHSAPRIFGHEMAGTIVQVGEGVTKFAVGERVMVFHHIPCGKCYYCRKQTPAQCAVYKKVGATAGMEPSGGGFAEDIRVMDWIVAMGGVVRIPDGVPF